VVVVVDADDGDDAAEASGGGDCDDSNCNDYSMNCSECILDRGDLVAIKVRFSACYSYLAD
jgi:hypothetical protein